jgi:hypothetical protein
VTWHAHYPRRRSRWTKGRREKKKVNEIEKKKNGQQKKEKIEKARTEVTGPPE